MGVITDIKNIYNEYVEVVSKIGDTTERHKACKELGEKLLPNYYNYLDKYNPYELNDINNVLGYVKDIIDNDRLNSKNYTKGKHNALLETLDEFITRFEK